MQIEIASNKGARQKKLYNNNFEVKFILNLSIFIFLKN